MTPFMCVQWNVNISAMDSNKDEAERCIKIALNAITNNDQEKARRFLEKAQRLFPTDKAKRKLKTDLCRLEAYESVGRCCRADYANVSITSVLSYSGSLLRHFMEFLRVESLAYLGYFKSNIDLVFSDLLWYLI